MPCVHAAPSRAGHGGYGALMWPHAAHSVAHGDSCQQSTVCRKCPSIAGVSVRYASCGMLRRLEKVVRSVNGVRCRDEWRGVAALAAAAHLRLVDRPPACSGLHLDWVGLVFGPANRR